MIPHLIAGTGERRGTDEPARVHCAACGGWFEPGRAGVGDRVRCTLCSHVVELGRMLRTKRRVPRTGSGAAASQGDSEREPLAMRAVLACLVLASIAVLVHTFVVRAESTPAEDAAPPWRTK